VATNYGDQMDVPSKAVIDVLTYLLPGFIAAGVVFKLTPAPRPIPFERVVQALVFTIVVQVLLLALRATLLFVGNHGFTVGVWTDHSQLAWSVAVALLLGLTVAHVANTDRLHATLRKLHITHQTSYSSEWYGAFCENRGFVVLHLSGQRRLYGWPEEWSSTPDSGHFVLSMAEWLEDGNRIELPGVDRVMVRATDVEMVEFMSLREAPIQEITNGRSESTDASATSDTESG
jgi:Family of unknown function (DUF6338)